MARQINPGHNEMRNVLRLIGPMVAMIGLGFTVVGIGNFFASFGTFEPPRYFWCAFVGMPLLGVGVAICKFAYLGAVSRYVAGEVAPVGKDVVHYMVDETKDSIRDVAAAVGEGFRGGAPSQSVQIVRCHKCNRENDASAKFCQECGAPLGKSKPCPNCRELNDPDARFCDNCGKAIG